MFGTFHQRIRRGEEIVQAAFYGALLNSGLVLLFLLIVVALGLFLLAPSVR